MGAPLLVGWWDVRPASPARPVRFIDAPGPALLRQNVPWLRTELNPLPTHVERIERARPEVVLGLFDVDALGPALAACGAWSAAGIPLVALRGRVVPAGAVSLFAAAGFDGGVLAVLRELGRPLPPRWIHPVVLVEAYHPRQPQAPYGAVFGRIPDPGLLDVAEIGRAERRSGAPPAAIAQDTLVDDLPPLLAAHDRAGIQRTIVIDNGGDAAALAEALHAAGRLGAWFGPASRPVPAPVSRARCPVYVWFEPEDFAPGWRQPLDHLAPAAANGCALAPIGLDGERPEEATARLLALRALGFRAVVPRYHAPVPNTPEWEQLAGKHPFRPSRLGGIDGQRPLFTLPGYERVDGPELLAVLARDNRWPDPPGEAREVRTHSLRELREVLDRYLADAPLRVPACHARDVFSEVLACLGPLDGRLTSLTSYPFLAWEGSNLLDLVQTAIELRLVSLDGAPEPVLRAVQHAALAGGKRIRPILVLAIACARGVSIEQAMPVALATEWIHTASLIQDDLPSMDDDAIRRRDVATHVRSGEGMALLASDTLIAMAIEDVAALRRDPAVGPAKVGEMLADIARALGVFGLVGGQAKDLITRTRREITIREVLDVHRHKTVPLFRLCAELAVTLADVEDPLRAELVEMLASLGLAFQIVDDVLDATPGNDAFGRPAGSDAKNALPTFATLLGVPAAQRYAEQLLAPYLTLDLRQPGLAGLTHLARYVLERRQ
jgi:geranylgeranyl pyrophosphate synthase